MNTAHTSSVPPSSGLWVALCNNSRCPRKEVVFQELCNKAVLRRVYNINNLNVNKITFLSEQEACYWGADISDSQLEGADGNIRTAGLMDKIELLKTSVKGMSVGFPSEFFRVSRIGTGNIGSLEVVYCSANSQQIAGWWLCSASASEGIIILPSCCLHLGTLVKMKSAEGDKNYNYLTWTVVVSLNGKCVNTTKNMYHVRVLSILMEHSQDKSK